MKHFVNSTLRLLLSAIGLSLAGVSAYLTAIFLYNYGSGTGYGFAYSAAGVLLDIAKTFFPIAALIAFRNGFKFISSCSLALCLVMMFTSYNISVAAISDSAYSQNKSSIEQTYDFKNTSEAISVLKSQIDTKKDRVARLRSVRYHDKADKLQIEIDQLSTELRHLLLSRGGKPVNSSNEFNILAAKILSALIEITSAITLVLVSAIGQPSASDPESPTPLAVPSQPPIPDVVDIEPQVESSPIVPPAVEPEVNSDPTTPQLDIAKALLAGGQARPSERSLSDAMSIRRPDAAQLLNELEECGFLVRDGRVRVLA